MVSRLQYEVWLDPHTSRELRGELLQLRAAARSESLAKVQARLAAQAPTPSTFPKTHGLTGPAVTRSEVSRSAVLYTVTAYCSCVKCCGKDDGITASGTQATAGRTIAADINKLPIGTVVFIEGVGERVVEDTGGAIKGNKIDVYFDTHQEALNFGRRTLEVVVID